MAESTTATFLDLLYCLLEGDLVQAAQLLDELQFEESFLPALALSESLPKAIEQMRQGNGMQAAALIARAAQENREFVDPNRTDDHFPVISAATLQTEPIDPASLGISIEDESMDPSEDLQGTGITKPSNSGIDLSRPSARGAAGGIFAAAGALTFPGHRFDGPQDDPCLDLDGTLAVPQLVEDEPERAPLLGPIDQSTGFGGIDLTTLSMESLRGDTVSGDESGDFDGSDEPGNSPPSSCPSDAEGD